VVVGVVAWFVAVVVAGGKDGIGGCSGGSSNRSRSISSSQLRGIAEAISSSRVLVVSAFFPFYLRSLSSSSSSPLLKYQYLLLPSCCQPSLS